MMHLLKFITTLSWADILNFHTFFTNPFIYMKSNMQIWTSHSLSFKVFYIFTIREVPPIKIKL